MQVASKKVYWKNNRVFSELNRCIFKISLKYIKFVKNYVPSSPPSPPNKITPPSTKIKISDPSPPAKTFLKFLTLPAGWRGGACLFKVTKIAKQIKFEGAWSKLEAKYCLLRQSWSKYFRQIHLIFNI